MDRIIVIGLLVSIGFGLAAHKARRAKKMGYANVYGWTGITGYVAAVGYMI